MGCFRGWLHHARGASTSHRGDPRHGVQSHNPEWRLGGRTRSSCGSRSRSGVCDDKHHPCAFDERRGRFGWVAWLHLAPILARRPSLGLCGLCKSERCGRRWRIECRSGDGAESWRHFDWPPTRIEGAKLALGSRDGILGASSAWTCRVDGSVGVDGRRFRVRSKGLSSHRVPLLRRGGVLGADGQTRVHRKRGRRRMARTGQAQFCGAVDRRCGRLVRLGGR